MSTKASARWGQRAVKLLLRFAVASSLLSAVADRLGLYPRAMSVWGDMQTFSDYTHSLMPWLPKPDLLLPVAVWGSTVCELLFGLALLLGLRLRLFARLAPASLRSADGVFDPDLCAGAGDLCRL